jgi:flagellar basal-body rod modification protein FlgD
MVDTLNSVSTTAAATSVSTAAAATPTNNLNLLTQADNPSTNTVAGQGLSGDLNTFLKLFTTQLQNQDPTQPLDTNQISAQLAQFSAVEQQVKTNSGLDKLIAAQRQTQFSTAVSYLNKEVETLGNTSTLQGGQATFSYFLPVAANSSEVIISDMTGRVVFKGPGTLDQGRNLVVWDGKNSFNQNTEPNGVYKITVNAKNANGDNITASTRAVGIVTGVESDNTGAVSLLVDSKPILFDKILAVREPVQLNLGTGNAS